MRDKSFFYSIIVILSIVASSQLSSQTWTPLTSGTTNDLVGVFAQSPCVAYVCGASGTILKTTNGGVSWVAETSGTGQVLYSISFINVDTGYAVGNNGAAVQTTNGGATWTAMSLATTDSYRNIRFFNSNVGYITSGPAGGGGEVYKTTDGGTTWTTVLTTPTSGVYSTYFTSLTTGYANEGVSGLIYKTTDGGATWTSVSTGLSSSGELWFTSPTNGVFVSNSASITGGEILTTTNAGVTWSLAPSGTSPNFLSGVGFYNANDGFVSGGDVSADTATLLQTTNGGATWSQVALPTGTPRLAYISFYNQATGYISGLGGTIFKYSPPAGAGNVSITGNMSICAGQSTTLTATGAVTYVWSTGATTDTIIVTPLSTTTYTVIGTGGCFSDTVLSTVAVITAPPNVMVNSATICNGQSVVLTASGANSYTWLPAIGLSSTTDSIITANPTTTTTYTVTGFNNCSSGTATATVVVNPIPVINVTPVTVCAGSSATLTATGGTTYAWSTGATTSFITAIPAITATYSVTGTLLGCNGTTTGTINVNSSPTVSITPTTVCNGQSGILTATGAATYVWSTGAVTTTITATPAATATYSVTGTLLGCSATATGTIIVNPLPNVTSTSAAVCSGQPGTLTASGASTYVWSTGTVTTNMTVTPTATATYSVTGTLLGCSSTATGTITVNPIPVITVNSETICTGLSATLTAIGANTYTWSPVTALSGSTGSTVTSSPTGTTNYTVEGTSANGCLAISTSTVTVQLPPVVSVNSASICAGSSATLIAVGNGTYSWSPATNLSSTTNATVTATPELTTTYTVMATNGCGSSMDTSVVKVIPSPSGNVSSSGIGCQSINALFTGSKGTPPYSFTYQLSAVSIGVTQSTIATKGLSNTANLSLQNVALGTYTCSLISVEDSNLCSSKVSNNSTTITVYKNPDALFTINPQQTTILTPAIGITDASVGAIGWAWNFGDSSTSFSPNPVSHVYNDTGVYTIKLLVSNSVGCKDSSYQTITITPFFAIYIPNTFTPNGDGINDIYTPKGVGILNYEMNIYDRWGNMIFQTNDIDKGWDGKANGGSQIAQMDTYVYTINVTASSNDNDYTYRGSFNLVR